MSIKDKSLKLAAVSLIADEAKKAKDRLRAELQEEMDSIGADRVKAELGDETVAYIMTTKPKFKWEITSDRKFLAWVKENMPQEIIESVRPSTVESILEKLKYVDDLIVAPNGEVIDWAVGSESNPYLTTKFHSDGRERLRNAIVGLDASNEIDVRKVLELE